ncbi:spore coat protein [Sporomusa malonica]|uniref:Coat F domain-containing protein n=1 Tax=Sporomusa malonica TaxID=112901 RepID=A0A1W2A4H5_9FIRM|nr:spore coat protein [Sporomusa malonica]SMC55546.1 Coat F domain-containing protein [Sporomusa malonica]
MSHTRRYGNNNTTSSRNRLSDRDMMVDLINTEKHLSHLYEHAIMESVNSTVHNAVEEFQHDEHENAYTLFKVMQERGWYNPVGQEQKSNNKKTFNVKSARRSQSGIYGRSSSHNQYQ